MILGPGTEIKAETGRSSASQGAEERREERKEGEGFIREYREKPLINSAKRSDKKCGTTSAAAPGRRR